jgi:hypothetical protein
MDRETMDYSLNQNVIFDSEEMLRGKLSDAEYDAIAGTRQTGEITGHFSNYFIVWLDQKLANGEQSVLVPADACKPLTCHWCRDSKLTNDTPFTIGQYEANAMPMKACPYCCPQAVNV